MIFNNSKEIDDQLGEVPLRSALADNILKEKLQYLGGIEDVDHLIKFKKYNLKRGSVNLAMRPKGLELIFRDGFQKYCYGLKKEDLIDWNLESVLDIVILEDESAVGQGFYENKIYGAIQTPLRKLFRDSEEEHGIEASDILSVEFTNNNGDEQLILFSVARDHIKDVSFYMEFNFPKTKEEITEDTADIDD